MEHILYVLLVTLCVSVPMVLFFHFVFDKISKGYRPNNRVTEKVLLENEGRNPDQERQMAAAKLRERLRNKQQRISEDEKQKLMYNSIRTEDHQAVIVTGHDDRRTVGVCAFLDELKIEYFVEDFMGCCVQNCNDLPMRSLMIGLLRWSEPLRGAHYVDLLCPNFDLVANSNTKETFLNERMKKYQEQFEYTLSVQYTGNFISHDADVEELWDDLIDISKLLLKYARENDTESDPWYDFSVEDWVRSKVELADEHFHSVPHSGQSILVDI